jgi:AraC family transcriptional regulator
MSTKNATELKLAERLSSHYIFSSDFYEIKNWAFNFKGEKKLSAGFNDCFCIVLVRNGSFHFDLASRPIEMHTGHVIVEKANYEYRMRPTTGACTILNFTAAFYEQMVDDYALKKSFFFSNSNILSLLLNASPEIDYLHHQIMRESVRAGKLEMDTLVLSLVQQIAGAIVNKRLDEELPSSLRRNHLSTIERAKDFMNNRFMDDISLHSLADHCHISPFHFSRLFKKFTTYSPHQYLLNIRLKHAEMLLRNTSQPVMDICFSAGFNSMNHFATMVRQKYSVSPSQLRKS